MSDLLKLHAKIQNSVLGDCDMMGAMVSITLDKVKKILAEEGITNLNSEEYLIYINMAGDWIQHYIGFYISMNKLKSPEITKINPDEIDN